MLVFMCVGDTFASCMSTLIFHKHYNGALVHRIDTTKNKHIGTCGSGIEHSTHCTIFYFEMNYKVLYIE